MLKCPDCGRENDDDARFCSGCGARLEVAARREVRKTVTVFFSDVTGSTQLGEQLDPESMRRVMARYFETMREVLERHGGTVEKFIGDAVMAVFGVPVLHEDDALRAVRAAVEIRGVLADLNGELEREWGVAVAFRTGVNTGEIVTGDGETLVTGDAVNVAARLEQAADPGEILLGDSTYRLVRDAVRVEEAGRVDLKGKSLPVAAFRLVDVIEGAPAFARRLDSPLVGRDHELELLRQAFERVEREFASHLFTVMGAAGVGKSRLVTEFLDEVRPRATVVGGRCLPYGDGITFWPLLEVVQEAASIADATPDEAQARIAELLDGGEGAGAVAERVAQAVGLVEGKASQEEMFSAVRKLLESIAGPQPLVVLFDDIHWAEPAFLDFIDHVADWSRDAPILLLCVARAELLESRPGWGGGKLNSSSILLESLTEDEADLLVENLLGRSGLTEDVRARVRDAAEGNPLFVEQMVGMLIDDGLLSPKNGGWVVSGELSSLAVPPTVQALIAARLDRLAGEERPVLERAAIEGKVFHLGAVKELSPEPARPDVSGHVMTLVRKELVRPNRPDFAGEDAFRFRHILIRDAAYEAMAKETRAQLHEQFAAWLERAAGDRVLEYEEILGYHLERAARYRGELGPADERTRELGRRASERLAAAGARGAARGDAHATANLLERAAALVDEPMARGLILVELGEALIKLGEFERARQVLADASASGDRKIELRARMVALGLELLTNPTGVSERILSDVEGLLPELEELGDDRVLAYAYRLLLTGDLMAARFDAASELAQRAGLHARRAGDRATELDALFWSFAGVTFGSTSVEEGIKRADDLLAEYGDSPRAEAAILPAVASLSAAAGRFDEARRAASRMKAIYEDLGMMLSLHATAMVRAPIEVLAGDLATAEAELRAGSDGLAKLGERSYFSTIAVMLADVVYRQGRHDEAEEIARTGAEAAAADDVSTQALWRSVQARVCARRGEHDEALRLMRESIALWEATDGIEFRGDALVAFAEVLQLGGRAPEAQEPLQRAIELYEQKGNVVSARATRAALERLQADVVAP